MEVLREASKLFLNKPFPEKFDININPATLCDFIEDNKKVHYKGINPENLFQLMIFAAQEIKFRQQMRLRAHRSLNIIIASNMLIATFTFMITKWFCG